MESEFIQFISTYGYVALVPLLIVEGPIVGFVAGVLSAAGVFNPYVVFVLLVISEFISDSFLFFGARKSPDLLQRFNLGRQTLTRAKNHPAGQKTGEYAQLVRRHFIKITLLLKSTPFPHIYPVTLITASLAGLSVARFYLMAIIVHPLRSAAVVGFGYFVGSSVENTDLLFSTIGIIVIIIFIVSLLYFSFIHNYIIEHTRLGAILAAEPEGESGKRE